MALPATTRKGNGSTPVTRFLNIQKTQNSRRNYCIALKQFFGFLEGEQIRRDRPNRTRNDADAIAGLDTRAVEYLSEVRSGERAAADDLVDFIAAMEREGYAPSSVHGARAGINGFFELNGIELSRLQEKVIKRTLPRSKVMQEEENISMDILRAILPLMHHHDRAVTLVLLSSGARIGEVLKLREKDLDLDASPARVTFRASTTKTKTRRTAFISIEAVDALKAWLAVRPGYIVTAASKMKGLNDNGYAGPKNLQDDRLFPFENSTFYRGWNTALRKAKLFERCEETGRATIHAHGLRKFFRTYFGAAAGVDVAEKLMGHEGYLTGAYVRLTEDDLARAYEKHCHVLMVSRGASAEIARQLDEQRLAMEGLQRQNDQLRAQLAAFEARTDKLDFLIKVVENSDVYAAFKKEEKESRTRAMQKISLP